MANILIVDDAAFMRMMIKDILSKNGYVVGEAEMDWLLKSIRASGLFSNNGYYNARNAWNTIYKV